MKVGDQLNRVTNRNYSGATPANYQASPNVSYTYRTAAPAVGALASVSTGTGSNTSTTEYLDFDILGRVTRSKQTTDTVEYGGGTDPNYWMTYSYNLSGALIEQQYPSGRVVRNTLDANGDLMAVLGSKVTHPQLWAYANNFKYNAAGAVTSLQLGNGNWESTQFNSRLQPTQIALGKTKDATDLLDLDYSYGTTQNNGNVLSQTITVPSVGATPGFTAVQNYSYDQLNRLAQADEKPQGWTDTNCTTDPTKCWKQTFKFDRYGNRRFDEANTTMPTSFADPAITNPTIDPSNNQLSSAGWSYDSSGNTKTDPSGKNFVYDSENKQVSVSDSSGALGQYFYDGDGRRVKKVVPSTGEVTIFVYDVSGKSIAEYSTIVTSSNGANVAYLTNDHLGSPRMNTDANGAVIARHDYHAFGENITINRNVGLNYSGDTVRRQFTAYERDRETDLDYAKARFYSKSYGRFTSVDPSRKSIDSMSPQTWNRYAYCYNNPLTLVDENGKWPSPTHDSLIRGSFRGLSDRQIHLVQFGSRKVDYVAEGKPGSTLWPSEAYKHAMTPDGMTSDQARSKAQAYLNSKLAEARALQRGYEKMGGTGISGSALIVVGEATHVYEDMTSPTHGFDKTYRIPTVTSNPGASGSTSLYGAAKSGSGEITELSPGKLKEEMDEHKAGESGEPTLDQRSATETHSRAFFLLVFGEKHFRQLDITDEERTAARELAASTQGGR